MPPSFKGGGKPQKQTLYLAVMCSRSSPAGFRPLRACPHFVSKSVRYARGNVIILFSPTAVRGYALALPCACAHSNTPAQLQKSKTK
jgi:hypothetical protein